jgi:ribosomal protein S18 acetylase RimI-like enzyme
MFKEKNEAMSFQFEILPLLSFTQEEIWPVITGYETQEIYTVEKTETDQRTVFDIRLVQLDQPYRASFFHDFTPEDCQWYLTLLPQGYSFGAYRDGRLIAFALGEAFPERGFLRVWEFHVMAEFRRRGVGRALMEQVIAIARQAQLAMLMLETQNTNVKAVRFYRSLGFSLDAIDCSQYFDLGGAEATQVAFYMKRRLDT